MADTVPILLPNGACLFSRKFSAGIYVQASNLQYVRKLGFSLLVLGVLLSSCGSSDSINNFSATGGNPTSGVSARALGGVWGGYFPGSSPQNPERGIEIHFARQNGAAFIHRASNRSKRYPVTSTITGDQVLILFGANSADEGRFTGSFVRENLLRGNYTNPSRGENYPLDLSMADGTGLAEVQGGVKPPRVVQVVSGPYVTLRLDFQAKDGFGSPNRSFSIHYGLGFATDREGGGTRASWKLVGGQSSLGNPGAEVTSGLATTSRLVFYPDWVVLDAFGRSNFNSLLSLELPRLDLVRLSGANLAEDASSVEAGQNKVWQVVDLALSYDSSPIPLDIVPLLTSAQNPKNQTVVLSGQNYQVPDNMFLFLSALPGPPFPP